MENNFRWFQIVMFKSEVDGSDIFKHENFPEG